MSGGGAGDRSASGALRAAGDRPIRGRLRTVRAELVGLSGDRVAVADLIIDGRVPACVSFGGDPFLLDPDHVRGGLVYRQDAALSRRLHGDGRGDAMMRAELAAAPPRAIDFDLCAFLDSGSLPWRRIVLSARDNIWALVDAVDYAWLSENTWNVSWGSRTPWQLYGKRNVGPARDTVRMHRVVKIRRDPRDENFRATHHVDHGNGQTLDNRDENLAWATNRQNSANRRPRSQIPSLDAIVLQLMREHGFEQPQEVPF